MDETALPQQLRTMLERYDSTVAEYEQERLTHDQAVATIKSLVAFDGVGARWTIDSHRNFCVQHSLESEPQTADPQLWVDPVKAISAPTDISAPAAAANSAAAARQPRPQRAPRQRPSFDWRRHKVTIAAVVVFATVTGGFLLFTGDDDNSNGALPSTSVTQAPETTATTEPAPTTTTAADVADTPSDREVEALIVELTSGDPDRIGDALVDAGGPTTEALARSFWAGTTRAGIAIVPSGDLDAGESVTQTWELTDATDDHKIGDAAVTYELDGNTWKLATWPAVSPSGD